MNYYQDISLIANSKEFRRLKDKTQLYNTTKGDHYRTRITHTIEVVSISLEIASNIREQHQKLEISDSLLIAIALGHDIGHTPFGHIGERVLNNIISGHYDNLSFNIQTMEQMCFKHNINSCRILLSKQFREYNQHKVLFSWKVLDGVLKHTSVYKGPQNYADLPSNVQNDPYALIEMLNVSCRDTNGQTILEFLNNNSINNYQKLNNALTIEGQIVAIADEIAQRVADIDDIVRAGHINDIVDSLKNIENTEFYKANANLLCSMQGKTFNGMDKVCKQIRNFLISEVQFNKNLNPTSSELYINKCIYFSGDESIESSNTKGEGYKVNNFFENIVNSIIKKGVVKEHDDTAKELIKNLFDKFYVNLYYLNNNGINDTMDEIITYGNIKNNTQYLFRNYNRSKKSKLIKIIVSYCKGDISADEAKSLIDKKEISADFKSFLYNVMIQNRIQVHSIVLRNICNYIAGMTDSYAKATYDKVV